MNFGIGIGELLISFLAILWSLALPIAIIFLLYKIYDRLKNIEELLKKD